MSKSQIPMKSQSSMSKFQWGVLGLHWTLEVGHRSFIGIWDLDIGIFARGLDIGALGCRRKRLKWVNEAQDVDSSSGGDEL
jgi:hypothetical protein